MSRFGAESHTFHRDVLDSEAQNNGPDHTESHLHIAVNNFCERTQTQRGGNTGHEISQDELQQKRKMNLHTKQQVEGTITTFLTKNTHLTSCLVETEKGTRTSVFDGSRTSNSEAALYPHAAQFYFYPLSMI